MMSQTINNNEAYTDVVELCALLQCLGFSVKSLDTSDGNVSQDGAVRSVVINCQSSGLHVVLESPSLSCSCPTTNHQNIGVWQVSGVTGGKQLDKEFGCSLLGSLPKSHRERLAKELHEMIRCIKEHNESDSEHPKEAIANKSASMIELKTPDKSDFKIKSDTPTRYRSLDTLTAARRDPQLPAPGPLQKLDLADASTEEGKDKKQIMCRRQSTYTLSSTPGSVRIRNKTSSPIHATQSTLLESLFAAEKAAEELHSKLTYVIREFVEDGKHDSSISSLTLDVSKISLLKCSEATKAQFSSSPNLSGLGNTREDLTKSRLKRFESASTSNLGPKSSSKDNKLASKLRRISPNIFKIKKEGSSVKAEKPKPQDAKSKLNILFKPKIVTPVRTPRSNAEASPNLSSSRKKFSHVKSTIPRPASKKE
ncbi:uncharacterized protein LOC113499386 [Trichoplusia ni]|uniref:Uncharacterized protein LOC113499386 n=1 Tax=Trichoplusia ni TaxID=7111 RepID=A0A7E5W605_TRINI|nr:uncharacterized protein LOC113499386 [Trichoplusia ni]